jgi:hypothetical protein
LCLLSESLKIKIHKPVIFPVFLYGCETGSLILREDHRLGAFENRVLKRIFGPARQEVGKGYIIRSFVTCMFHQILLG